MRVRARWVLPISAPPIEDGEVVTDGSVIEEVRPRPLDGRPIPDALDFGEAVILPGLVNSHSHIEYTALRGIAEDLPMIPWLRTLIAYKDQVPPERWASSAVLGAAELAAGGVTTVADCTDSGAALDGLLSIGLRGVVYKEAFGIADSVTVRQAVADLQTEVSLLARRAAGAPITIGISPHAVYTVRPDLMRALAAMARAAALPVSIHAAESQPEAELTLSGSGGYAEALCRRGIGWATPGKSVIAYLDELGALRPNTILAHCVNISAADRRVIQRTGTSVAICAKSNAKLGNGAAPLGLLMRATTDSTSTRAHARLGIGTDSAAGSNRLDMFEEMRFCLLVQRAVSRQADRPTARDMLTMATLGGARALGLDDRIGSLEPNKAADIAVIGLRSPVCVPVHDPYAAIVHTCTTHDVLLTVADGRVVADQSKPESSNVAEARLAVAETARGIVRSCT